MAKKKEENLEDLLEESLVPENEQPYGLPDGWLWVKLGSLAQLLNGDRSGNYPSKDEFTNSGVPFINAGHLGKGTIDFRNMNYITGEKYRSLRGGKIEIKDILYCLRGSLGKSAIVDFNNDATIASSLVIIRANFDVINPDYLYNYLISPTGLSFIDNYKNGSAQPNLSANSLRLYCIPLPPLNEQKRIADKLDSMLGKIKEAREKIQEARDTFATRRASILHKAFSGQLTKQSNNISQSLDLLKDIAFKQNKDFDSFLNEALVPVSQQPYDIPKYWKWCYIGSLTEVISGGTPNTKNDEYYSNAHIPWVTPADLSGYTDKYISRGKKNISLSGLQNSSAQLIPENSVLLSSRAPIGYVVVAANTVTTSQGFKSFAPSLAFIPGFCYWYLIYSTNLIESMASGSTFKEISKSKTEKIPFPVPPLDEQKEIASVLDKLLDFEEEAKRLSDLEEHLDLLEKSILNKAFRGELNTSDPSDESAIESLANSYSDKIEEDIMRLEKEFDEINTTFDIEMDRLSEEYDLAYSRLEYMRMQDIYKYLIDKAKNVSVQKVFYENGFSHETIESFYSKIKELINDNKIEEIRIDDVAYLRAKI